MLAEAAMAEVRWATQHANEHTKDAVWKAMEELQRLQSPAKGKRHLVSTIFLQVVMALKVSIGQCYTGEGEGHAGDSEGFAGGCKEWWVEAEGE